MSTDQKRARWFGALYLITFITSIPALLLYESVLHHPTSYITGAVALVTWTAAASIGTYRSAGAS